MRRTELIMGMPVTIEIVGEQNPEIADPVFDFFRAVDQKFSTYKTDSEISLLNSGELALDQLSEESKEILKLAEQTKQETLGYFDIRRSDGKIDPSGIVKGWAILRAADMLKKAGFTNFYVDAGGDIQISGHNSTGQPWQIGIKNPFNEKEIVKVVSVDNQGIATSGTYIRGQHIYNPKTGLPTDEIASLTVIGPDVYEADRFATAAFAMGANGINFIEQLPGFEGYMINKNGIATKTSGFKNFETKH